MLIFALRTPELLDGFKKELGDRVKTLQTSRAELEQLFAKRVDDAEVDDPQHSEWKSKVMIGLRTCESAFTSYAGSIRSIKAVVDTFLFQSWHCFDLVTAWLYL